TEQLTDTLRAANGPPDNSADTAVPSPNSDAPPSPAPLAAPGFVGPLPPLFQAAYSPGNSPGELLAPFAQFWNGGQEYIWEVNDIDAGEADNVTHLGWDIIRVNGGLTVTATSANKFNVRIKSLVPPSPPDTPGAAADFNPANTYSWRILSTTTGVHGFNRDAI